MYVEPGTFFVTDSFRRADNNQLKYNHCAFYILDRKWCKLLGTKLGRIRLFDYRVFSCRCDVAIIVGDNAVQAYPATEEEAFELAASMLQQ